MGITDWQRRLLETLTNLESGQAETNRRLANVETSLGGIESRIDNALTNVVGEPVRELRSRVERLERAVFRPENPE